jgi:hypothetical protein
MPDANWAYSRMRELIAEKEKLVRSCVDKTPMTPDTLEVEITFKVPEAIGAYTGSGDPLHYYLHQFSSLAGEEI